MTKHVAKTCISVLYYIHILYIHIYIYTHEWRTKLLVYFPAMRKLKGRPPSVVRISAFTDFEAAHAKQGYRYRFVPYQ